MLQTKGGAKLAPPFSIIRSGWKHKQAASVTNQMRTFSLVKMSPASMFNYSILLKLRYKIRL
ncbi:hypothetical protein [Aeromonas salmonicida]|jgi:hypothetical protein|uniref:hypothetical protein n=1 Tax=Aeromonas salmonicida TaxID=645 RepID=UPI002240A78D|nr:hypothetical protein [Aeromonas salmonicida]